MKENINMFKEWYKLAKPHKGYWTFQFITVLIPSFCLLSEAMYTAKATTCLADKNYQMAIFCLCLVLFFMFLRNFSSDLNYRNTLNLVGYSYKKIQNKIFDHIVSGKEKNFLNNSKEKLINIFHSDVYDVAKFSDTICTHFKYFFQIILTLFYVFTIKFSIGILLIFIIFLNYFIINKINIVISKANKKVKESIDDEFVVFSEVIDSKNIMDDLNIKQKIKNKYLKSNEEFLKKQHHYTIKTSYLDNYFYIFFKSVIFICTLFMIFLLSHDVVSLTIYLVIISYLTDSITNSKDFLKILTELKNTYIAANRVNIILNFDEKEELVFGNIAKDRISGEIDFVKVCYKPNSDDIGLTELKNISFSIPSNSFALFYGSRNSGKRTIFYLLRRVIKPTSGNIYLDKINSFDFIPDVYKTNLNYLTTKPYFYNGTIYDNLKIVKPNKKLIEKVLKKVNLYDYIMSLPNKLKTNIKDLQNKDLYLLSLARVLLLDSEIIILYEFPIYLSEKDEKLILEVLNEFKNKKTILIFSASDKFKNVVDLTFTIQKGTLKKAR